ncbi:unnamed protein product [Meloidogyne enterolobii]|uniref:Uncharacterized protein n=1 Tax=Meloidogyne enterolobii TaxID=390850 RepID=A0ACB0XSY6_MELEN
MNEQSRPYDTKKNCWVPDQEEGYVAAEITSTKGDQVTVKIASGEKTVKKELIQEMNPPKFEKTEDMSNLTFLNDASVLYNLRARYKAMLIYTYSGLFCVVINPYKRLPIYTDSVARFYMGKRRTEMPPHLFAVSDEAYRNMLQNKENQSMLITGESGAGKTENTKKVIAYFASVGASQAEAAKDKPKQKMVTLEDQIVQTNPVLEAFGNAKTVRNNNSSRFGKFIRIHFNRAGRVASCDIEHYLLEKSRVIRQAPGERCYHIFYQICSGFKPDLMKKLKLNKPLKEYWFVAQAELTIDGIDDKEEFKLTDEAFDVLNFSETEKNDCYKMMGGIMHMGNMKFKQRPREEQAEPDETEEANYAAENFGIDMEQQLTALTKPRVRVGSEWVSKGQNLDQVNWAIGAMSKALYARVFEWLVKKCNLTLDQKGLSRDSFIGVLDIAGFEIFDFNSFEQLWINFVNEKLQQFFNHHMFVLEQEEYAREGIAWTFIDFGLDLQACIELIEKPMGIISMLDEECIVPKASDLTYAQKLGDQHLGKHPNFEKPKPPKGKQGEAHFAMRHYAGTVRYNVINWLEKNKDPLNDTLVSVMKNAKGNQLIIDIWADYQTQEEAAEANKKGGGGKKKGKSGSFMTVSMLYRESLNNLMNMLHKTHPHFIRCIIPNEKKQSGMIDAALVLNQLTCNGVLEGIRICRKGFPNRLPHNDFKVRYGILAAAEARSSTDPKVSSANILEKLVNAKSLEAENFKVGHTKVFFKAGVLAHIEELRDKCMNDLMCMFQSACRAYLAKMGAARRRKQLDAYSIVQRNIRSWCVLRTWEWYLLYGRVKPLCKGDKHAEELEKMEADLKASEEILAKQEEQRKAIEAEHNRLAEERRKLQEQLEIARKGGSAVESEMGALNAQKTELERRLEDAKDKLNEQQQKAEDNQRSLKRAEKDKESLNDQIETLNETLNRVEEEKRKTEERIRERHEAIAQQDEAIAAANKERKKAEEENRRLAEELHSESEKGGQSVRSKAKLERSIEDIEDTLDRERRHRIEQEKSKKKAESELHLVQEQLEEFKRQKSEAESKQQIVEQNIVELNIKLDEQNTLVSKLQRYLKDQSTRLVELEEELEQERVNRSRSDKNRGTVQTHLDELSDLIDEEAGKAAAQAELAKKKDLELIRLRQELEEINQQSEQQLSLIRKRNNDEISEATERLENLQNARGKTEKDKETLRRQIEDIQSQQQDEQRQRNEYERQSKNLESQVHELQTRYEEQHRLIQELQAVKQRLQTESSDQEQQLEESETHLGQIGKLKAQALAQLEEAKRSLEEEHQERMEASAQLKGLEHEIEQIREAIDEEIHNREETLKHLSKAKAETQQWRGRFEGEGLVAADELEEERRRRLNQKLDLSDHLGELNSKLAAVEKTNAKLLTDAEEARAEAERAQTQIFQWQKKQEAHEFVIKDWRRQCDELSLQIERTQEECRRSVSDVFALQSASTSLSDQADELRRENKTLSLSLRDLQDQLSNWHRNMHDIQKKIRQLELEKETLQHALEEAESALELEEGKVQRLQTEVSQIRTEIDRRIREKEEDFENTIKNHQRAIESIRTSLENEQRAKQQLIQSKKKLETDINDLELALDMANKTNVEAQKNIKKQIAQIQELQLQVEEEQRKREEQRENFLMSERKLNIIASERDELLIRKEAIDREKSRIEAEVQEERSRKGEYQVENAQLNAVKRQLDNDLQIVKTELDKTLNELKIAEEVFKKVNADLTRLNEELKNEQHHHDHLERQKRLLDSQLKELQLRLDQAEATVQRVGQRTVDQLQQLIIARNNELDSEQKRHKEIIRQLNKSEREVREKQFQVEEQRKCCSKMHELIEKLQAKIRVYKKQTEEAEEVAAMNLQKFRQIQSQLDEAEERADEAENSLLRVRSKIRVNATPNALSSSRSSAHLPRAASSAYISSNNLGK